MSPAADPEDCDDVKEAIRSCLRKAALVNYTRISKFAKVEGKSIAQLIFYVKLSSEIKYLKNTFYRKLSNHSALKVS